MTEDARALVGRVVGVFGIRGAIKVESLTDFPERFAPGAVVWIGGVSRKIVKTHWHNDQVRIQVEGIETPEQAEALRGKEVQIPSSLRPKLGSGEFMNRDLEGLRVVDVRRGEIGRVDAIHKGAAHDHLEISGILVPAIKEFVKEIDLEAGVMTVDLIDGMAPGEESE